MDVRLLPGLPAYGPPATPFPAQWGRLGREGTVVGIKTESGRWVGNFQPGLGGIDLAGVHPNRRDAVVVTGGDLYVIQPELRTAERLLPAIDAALEVRDPEGWVFSRQGLALARLGPEGIIWHTRRLSWDGFDQLSIKQNQIQGLAWSPLDEQWYSFALDLRTGKSTGGSFGRGDTEHWEKCYHEPDGATEPG
jgi:hypothetical protein